MTVNEILKKYSKEVIIEWVTNRYPVFMNEKLKEELEEAKAEVEYRKIQKELDSLFKEQEKLRKKKLDFNIEQKFRKNRQRIDYLLKEADKYINLKDTSEGKNDKWSRNF